MNLNNLMVQRKIKFLIFKTHTIECRTNSNILIQKNEKKKAIATTISIDFNARKCSSN
jgi:hypothetical protein